jgi:hypothetical protein
MVRGRHRGFYADGVPSVQSTCQHTSYGLTKATLTPRHGRYEKCLCAGILTPVGNQLPHPVSKINPRVRQRLSWGRTIAALGYRQTRRGRQSVTTNAPMAVRVATILNSSPGFPAGFTKDVEISVDTPVMYWPWLATASEPSVSVRDMIRPPCTVYALLR